MFIHSKSGDEPTTGPLLYTYTQSPVDSPPEVRRVIAEASMSALGEKRDANTMCRIIIVCVCVCSKETVLDS